MFQTTATRLTKTTSTTSRKSNRRRIAVSPQMPRRNTVLSPAKALLRHVGRRALDIAKDEGREAYYTSGLGRAFNPSAGHDIVADHIRLACWKSQSGRCMYCAVHLQRGDWHIDHKIPVSLGGANEVSNYQALCVPCNLRKGQMTDKQFRNRYRKLVRRYWPWQTPEPPPKYIPQSEFKRVTRATRRR